MRGLFVVKGWPRQCRRRWRTSRRAWWTLRSVREIFWSLWSDWDRRRRRGRIISFVSPLIMHLWSVWNVLWRLVVVVVGFWDVHLVEGKSENIYER